MPVVAAFTCANCGRHKMGDKACVSSRGVVCSDEPCQPRDCRCRCCDEHCDPEACAFLSQRKEWGSR